MKRMERAVSKEEARATGIQIAQENYPAIQPYVSGVQVSAPFGNVDTALNVLFPDRSAECPSLFYRDSPIRPRDL
jgi:hypothetical protein